MSVTAQDTQRSFKVIDARFEHSHSPRTLGTHHTTPRLSWKFQNAPDGFQQRRYSINVFDSAPTSKSTPSVQPVCSVTIESCQSVLVPWPANSPLKSRQQVFVQVQAAGIGSDGCELIAEWSDPISIEAGLLKQSEWRAQLITSPWEHPKDAPQPEDLFRTDFVAQKSKSMSHARLYITAQGLYEAEINGRVVGDHFLAPGWTTYDSRLPYQVFDVSDYISSGSEPNAIGVRVAEGWFCGRLSWGAGQRNIWGERPALLAQLEIWYTDGTHDLVVTDSSWTVRKGPTVLAELYNGEKYDARLEIPGWSSPLVDELSSWAPVSTQGPFPESVHLHAQEAEPVRKVQVVTPLKKIITPSGKTVVDFGQNLVGFTRLKSVHGSAGHQILFSHAEVLDHGELGRRPLRRADNVDIYTLKGSSEGESWEPRFTFHGFRYVEVGGWTADNDTLLQSIEAVVTHTDMKRIGQFSCSDPSLNKLHENISWSMRGNFVSIPTDCPQRDERLGWTGDLALFAPTASYLYDCTSMLDSWLDDVHAEQRKNAGVPPFVIPNVLEKDPFFGNVKPASIWGDVVVLAPWALYEATGDVRILESHYQGMVDWLESIPRNQQDNTHLWDDSHPQLGDWLDPAAPPDRPNLARTDAVMVSNAYLIHSLQLASESAKILGKADDATKYETERLAALDQFTSEYVTPGGRLMADSQTGYALAIAFDLLSTCTQKQKERISERLAFIVRRNAFKISTGFAGTPFICEALTQAGYPQIAYSMLKNQECPSWLYPVSMGATTTWERWDSMLPDGSINPGEMTSFNHYAFGAVAKFMWERLAGLQCASPGWSKSRIAPIIGGDIQYAEAMLDTPYGLLSTKWRLEGAEAQTLTIEAVIPPNTSAEIVFPDGVNKDAVVVGSGTHSFSVPFVQRNEWPVQPLREF